ncbi:hypothetical protein RRSWK_04032 [Rhodopirellula sp. SWK7]|nr:hypothetical protein RRSWK_04032 [Rhodopirellula sp. SWK7]
MGQLVLCTVIDVGKTMDDALESLDFSGKSRCRIYEVFRRI